MANGKARRKYTLNEKEERINRSGGVAALPGVLRDYSSEKHQDILENFLGGRPSRSTEHFKN